MSSDGNIDFVEGSEQEVDLTKFVKIKEKRVRSVAISSTFHSHVLFYFPLS